jgi:predicted DCC family thiol-disulfide oxidoreductase YuxK
MNLNSKSKIFVDGNCIVCDNEISHYKRMAPEAFEIIDISSPNFNAADYSLTTEVVNKKMHVLTPEGEIKIGVEAFAHIWGRIQKYNLAAKLIKWPIIHPLAKLGYNLFATIRPLLPKRRR